MDNFRKIQPPKHNKRGFSLDGVLNARPKTPGVGASRTQSASAQNRQTIGDFRQPGGFRAAAQPVLPESQPFHKASPAASDFKAKKSKPKQPHKIRTLLKRTSLALAVLLMLGGGYVSAKAYLKSRHVLKGGGSAAALQADVDPSLLKGEGDGRINILILGKGGDGHEGPDLTDTLLIASIDPVHKDAALVSIPRDFWVKPSGGYSYTKINSIYANAKYAVQNGKKIPNQAQAAEKAGNDAIERTLEDTLGIPIHYHAMVDFEAFRKSIDTVGGIDINVKTQLYDPTVAWENKWNPVIAAVGQQHFDGKKALLYARSRHGSARGDFDRSERQREIIMALKDKVLNLGTFSNPVKVSQLIDAFGDHVQTNFTSSEVMRLYAIAKQIPSAKITSVGLADPPNDYITTGNVSGISVVLPKAGVGNYAEIQSYLRNALKDSYIKDENASIVVLNGTNKVGYATTKATELKSFGYNVTQIADAPTKDYSQTILVDLRNGAKKYSQHYLENRLGVKATTKLPSGITAGTADFVIVLGQSTSAE